MTPADPVSGVLIFLDFDGVLHPKGCAPSDYFAHLPRLEAVLRDFATVRVVISSTWQDAYSLPALRRRFSDDIAARIVGVTGSGDPDGEAETRHAQIAMYLRHAGMADVPWVAVDDAADEFPAGCAELVLCDSTIGLDAEAEERLRATMMRVCSR